MRHRRINLYRILCLLTGLLFLYLFMLLLFQSETFVMDLGLQANLTSSILARRAAMFMLGLSTLLFLSNNLSDQKSKQFISLSTGITLLGLACMSSYELFRGTVNSSMLQAIIIETSLGILFWISYFRNLFKKRIQ